MMHAQLAVGDADTAAEFNLRFSNCVPALFGAPVRPFLCSSQKDAETSLEQYSNTHVLCIE
jgi:hypothetical protein